MEEGGVSKECTGVGTWTKKISSIVNMQFSLKTRIWFEKKNIL